MRYISQAIPLFLHVLGVGPNPAYSEARCKSPGEDPIRQRSHYLDRPCDTPRADGQYQRSYGPYV